MKLLSRVLQQSRKPTGRFGRLLARGMNLGHAGLTAWGLGHLDVGVDAVTLDIGCGGGRTLERMASMAESGMAVGVDYSAASLAVARTRNRHLIDAGRVQLVLGDAADLPFAAATFDVVTAVETYYFWPDLSERLREVGRVARPGAVIAIIAGMYRGSKLDRRNLRFVRAGDLTWLSPIELEQSFEQAGFSAIRVETSAAKGWICAVGQRPPR